MYKKKSSRNSKLGIKNFEKRRPQPQKEEVKEDIEKHPEVLDLIALDGQDLLNYFRLNPIIKSVVGNHPKCDSIEIIDFSIKARGKEDAYYLRDLELQERLRRGNTLVRIYNEARKIDNIIIGRRGLPKFFDLRAQHFSYLMETSNINNLKKERELYFEWRTFMPRVKAALENGEDVTIISTDKANGENAQITYISDPSLENFFQVKGMWLVCSKNVAVAFRDLEDIECYQEDRYYYAKLIAKCWLRTFTALNPDQKNRTIVLLSSHTIIGEYCGNPDLQHLVRYDSEKLSFFGMVIKKSVSACVAPQIALAQLSSLGLSCVGLSSGVPNKSMRSFATALVEHARKVAASPVKTYGEGLVLYFQSAHKVLGICKLKTLEYRYFRKLREKLKQFLNNKLDKEKLLKRYRVECVELKSQGNFDLAKPLDYYLGIAEMACEIAKKCKVSSDNISSQFIDFLETAERCFLSKKRQEISKEINTFVNRHNHKINECKVGAQIIIIAPPGFINFKEVRKYSEELGFNFSYGHKIEETENNLIKICTPHMLEGHSFEDGEDIYYVYLSIKEEEIIDIISKSISEEYSKININQVTDHDERLYLNLVFNSDFTKNAIKSAIQLNLELQKSRKAPSFVDIPISYASGLTNNPPSYRFNYSELDLILTGILKEHKNKKKEGIFTGRDSTNDIQEISDDFEVEENNAKENIDESNQQKKDNYVLVIAFYALSSIGKTHFIELLMNQAEKSGINSFVVSSDECSKIQLQKLRSIKANQNLSEEVMFKKCKSGSKKLFFDQIFACIGKLKPGNNILILDKVMNSGVDINIIADSIPMEYAYEFAAIFPKTTNIGFKYGSKKVPFSASLITNICFRSLNRKEHPVIIGTDERKLLITLSFVKLYENIKDMRRDKGKEAEYEYMFDVPFTPEVPEKLIPVELLDLLEDTLSRITKPFGSSPDICEDLVDLLLDKEFCKKLIDSGIIGFPALKEQQKSIDSILSIFEINN